MCACVSVYKRAYVRIYVCLLAYFSLYFSVSVATAANKDVYKSVKNQPKFV